MDSPSEEARFYAFLGYLSTLAPLPALRSNYPIDAAINSYGLDAQAVEWIRYYDFLTHDDNAHMRNSPAADMHAMAHYVSALAQRFDTLARYQHTQTGLVRQQLFNFTAAPSGLPLLVTQLQQRLGPRLTTQITDLTQLRPCLDPPARALCDGFQRFCAEIQTDISRLDVAAEYSRLGSLLRSFDENLTSQSRLALTYLITSVLASYVAWPQTSIPMLLDYFLYFIHRGTPFREGLPALLSHPDPPLLRFATPEQLAAF